MADLPLIFASGAGANSRHSLGTGAVGGMTMATALGVFFIPVLYVLVAGRAGQGGPRWPRPEADSAPQPPAPEPPAANPLPPY